MKDICCIGHVTKDKIVTPNSTVYMAGGTSFYFAYAINQLPKDVSFSLITAMDPTENRTCRKDAQGGNRRHLESIAQYGLLREYLRR